MSVLVLKLVRDLWRARWQYLAVGALVTLGVTFFGGAYMSYQNLDASYHYAYDQLLFEHFGIVLHAAPERVVDRLRRVPGIQAVEGRLVEDGAVELPGVKTKKLVGRLTSIPADQHPAVNDLMVVQGRYLTSHTAHEVLLESKFAEHHGLKPGDPIEVVRGGGRVRFRIAGIVKSPEYIYVVQSKQQLMPSPDTFGVMFVSQDVLGPLVGKSGQINEVKVRTTNDAHLPLVLREVERLLKPYGPEEPVQREDQPSHQLLQQDLQSFQSYAVLFPLLFLSVAGLTVYTLLMRMVHLQRPVIGLLRAVGFTPGQVVWHYLSVSLVLGTVGSLVGSGLGFALAAWITRLYVTFIAVPYVVVEPHGGTLLTGFLVGTGVCFLAGILPARSAARISPAAALRAAAPETGRVIPLDRLLPGSKNLPLRWRIPLRNLFRHPRRTLSTLFGIAAAIGLIMVAQGLLDSSEVAINQIFREAMIDDIRVGFIDYQDAGVVNRVHSWRGVIWAESLLEIPVDFKKGERTYSALLVGMERGGRLSRLKTESGMPVSLSDAGMLLGQTVQMKLGVVSGDAVQVVLPRRKMEEEAPPRAARVVGFVWEPIGTVAYLPIEKARQLFRDDLDLPPGAISSIRVKADPRYLGEIKERLLDLPGVGAVEVITEIRQMIEDLMKLSRRFVFIMLLFGAALAFSIVFNMVTINVLERSNEVATIRTLGLSRWRIAAMIMAENLLTALVGVMIGFPLGRGLVELFIMAAMTQEQMELFSFKAVVFPRTYLLAAVVILLVVLLSQLPALSHVNRLNLAKATKERAT